MQIGLIGLGKMGGNMARRWMLGGHTVVGYARTQATVKGLEAEGMKGARSVEDLVSQLPTPRAIWVMVPAGEPTERAVALLGQVLERGDTVIDGGNTYYKDDIRRSDGLAPRGLRYLDQGTSGGIWGLKEGFCLMIGGAPDAVAALEPAFKSLAPAADRGWGRVGPVGAGHFVKMIHNGIEYGMMQSYAEGFQLMQGKKEFAIDLAGVGRIWRDGSVVRSWLLDLTTDALGSNPTLSDIEAWVSDSGEGRWTVQESIEQGLPAPVIALSLMARFRSRQGSSFADRLLAAMRNQFGGHAIKKSGSG